MVRSAPKFAKPCTVIVLSALVPPTKPSKLVAPDKPGSAVKAKLLVPAEPASFKLERK